MPVRYAAAERASNSGADPASRRDRDAPSDSDADAHTDAQRLCDADQLGQRRAASLAERDADPDGVHAQAGRRDARADGDAAARDQSHGPALMPGGVAAAATNPEQAARFAPTRRYPSDNAPA